MTWLLPGALWLLPLAVLPLLLRRRTPPGRRVVSALHLWPATAAPAAPRGRRVTLTRRSLLQAGLIACLVLLLAGPRWSGPRADLVLIVDLSASMGATSGAGTRLDAARDAASAALASTGVRRARLFGAGAEPADLGVLTRPDLTAALAALAPESGGAALQAAVTLAAAAEPDVPVWVLTDHPLAGEVRTLSGSAAVRNVAVTALEASRGAGDALAVSARVENVSREAVSASLTFERGGAVSDADTLDLQPGAAAIVTRDVSGSGGTVEARVAMPGGDDLPADDARMAVATAPVRVHLADAAGPYLPLALAANIAVQVAEQDADILICRACPDAPAAAGVLRLATGTPLPARPVDMMPAPHPVTTGLSGLAVDAAAVQGGPLPGTVLARAGDQPVLAAGEQAGRRIVALAADVDDPAFAASPFFAVLVANALDWLAGRDNPRTLDAGAPLRWWFGGPDAATLIGPDGRPRAARVRDGWLTSTDTANPGLHTVRSGRRAASLTIGLPAAESRPPAPETLTIPAPPPPEARSGIALAPWVGAFALLLVLADGQAGRLRGRSAWAHLACAGLVLLAMAGVRIPTGRGPLAVVFALDRSDSVTARQQLAAARDVVEFSRTLGGGDTAGLVTFAGRAQVRRPPAATPLTADLGVEPRAQETDIAQGLDAALALVPDSGAGRIALYTDGRDTRGTVDAGVAAAAAAGVAVDVRLLAPVYPLARVRALTAPPEVRPGEAFDLLVHVHGPAAGTAPITITGGPTPLSVNVPLDATGRGQARVSARAGDPGLAVYRAHVGDQADPDAPGVAVTVLGTPRALLLREARGQRGVTGVPAFATDIRTPGEVPLDGDTLSPYTLVVLDAVPGEVLRPEAAAALARWVEDGGGLVVLGSTRSLPPGGFAAPAVDRLLPAELRIGPGSRGPATATVIAIDTSGSMADHAGGLQKLEAARDAARRALGVLPPDDQAGLLAFDIEARGIVPLARLDRQEPLEPALARLVASGATRMAPAVTLAAGWLAEAGVSGRHLLVVSDGRASADDLARAADTATSAGVTVSVIAIGEDADREALTRLATRTGGRAYFPETLAELPGLAARDVVASRGGATVETPTGLRAPHRHPILRDLDLSSVPLLGGYVVAVPRPGAARALDSSLGDPVLLTGRAGLGRVVLLTTDLGHSWSAPLRGWVGYSRLMAQAWQWAARRDRADGLELALEETSAGPRVAVRADRVSSARVLDPAGRVAELLLEPVEPGILAAPLQADGPGVYRIEVTGGDGDQRLVRGLVRPADLERTGAAVDDALLERITRATGGRRLADGESPFSAPRPMGFAPIAPVPQIGALLAALAIAAGLTTAGATRPGQRRAAA